MYAHLIGKVIRHATQPPTFCLPHARFFQMFFQLENLSKRRIARTHLTQPSSPLYLVCSYRGENWTFEIKRGNHSIALDSTYASWSSMPPRSANTSLSDNSGENPITINNTIVPQQHHRNQYCKNVKTATNTCMRGLCCWQCRWG